MKRMLEKAKADGQPAAAITDHGNMFGVFDFVKQAQKVGVKPIVGCEFYVVEDRHQKQFSKENKDIRYHQLFLAKNEVGYRNLIKLCSLGYTEGLYSKWPRIDKELIDLYKEGLIATTCCIGAEVPQAILAKGEDEAEKVFRWWYDRFGEDYYIELQRHKLPEQEQVNKVLVKWAAKYNVKMIATNDSHYVDREDHLAHDILLCVNTGELLATPKGDGKGFRFGFPNDEFFFKSQDEMNLLFQDLPEAIDNTNEIVDKVTPPNIKRDILLPNFPIPQGFAGADAYLRHLTFGGAVKRYGTITPEIEERLNFELEIIEKMGFAGYFLIVQDFIKAGRDSGVSVGPGRGSAAGSAVAYCVGITNIDPIKYSLLFERFLNPERVTMPDVDIDFDDEGREKVIQYVIDKYGRSQVAQIVTFGSMAAKSAIKDVARVMGLPLTDANLLTKMVPDGPQVSLKKAFAEVSELRDLRDSNKPHGEVLRQAEKLEGSIRSTGIHAAGIIIAPDDLTNFIPLSKAKEGDFYVSQFDKDLIEEAGMLKMDFLGLKTLTIIRDAQRIIEETTGDKFDIDEIDLEDQATFDLYQRGDTVGTFQFESTGMRQYLKELKPTNIEDLIAMNALYRPGPMQFIPLFIDRKQGREEVKYPHDLLEPILKHTYGIMVYQEQIMQTAQILAGYSLGGADLLRRAMGKKDKEKMAKERIKFVEGAGKLHNIEEAHASEVFDQMEKFAEYGFNRSHSAAYSVLAYQTAYLKANYPAAYMASVLTHNMSNIKDITFFLDECRRMGLNVLGPDINESRIGFSVNTKGDIRFGLGAIKGLGEAAIQAILEERKANGPFKDIFELAERMSGRSLNRKVLECLAYAGALDNFEGLERWHIFAEENGSTFAEKVIRYGQSKTSDAQAGVISLFGGGNNSTVAQPRFPTGEGWNDLEKLKYEKEVIGFYLSGHPLDRFKWDIEAYTSCPLNDLLVEDTPFKNKEATIAGIVVNKTIRTTKTGNPFCICEIEDWDGKLEIALMGSDYLNFQGFMEVGRFLLIKGRVQLRYNQKDQWEFKPTQISLLSEAREKVCKGIAVEIDLDAIEKSTISFLKELTFNFKGKTPIQLTVIDTKNNSKLAMQSRELSIAPENEALQGLENLSGVRSLKLV